MQNRVVVGEHGGIALLVRMLEVDDCDVQVRPAPEMRCHRRGTHERDVQRSTCLALNEACLKNAANSREFQRSGAIPRVMRVLQTGNTDLQTQALAVLGTSAVNAVEVRRGLQEAGAIPLLVSLLASNASRVQEWAAYALRKASSRATDLELAKVCWAH